jgi:hypothetical protein
MVQLRILFDGGVARGLAPLVLGHLLLAFLAAGLLLRPRC